MMSKTAIAAGHALLSEQTTQFPRQAPALQCKVADDRSGATLRSQAAAG
jgi:hypothetical protein